MTSATQIGPPPTGPADAASPFPESAALVLKEWAAKAGDSWSTAVNAALDKIKDTLGHPDLVTRRALEWGPGASGLLTDAGHGLGSVRDNAKMYWEGKAFDAFDTYVTGVVQTSRDAAKLLVDLSKLVQGMSTLIVGTYVAMINHLSDAARGVLDAVSGVAGMVADALTPLAAIAMAVSGACDVMNTFIKLIDDLSTGALNRMAEFMQSVQAIASDASLLVLPDPIAAGVSISDNWDVSCAD